MERSIMTFCTRTPSRTLRTQRSCTRPQTLTSISRHTPSRPAVTTTTHNSRIPSIRCLHASTPLPYPSAPPKSRDRGPKSNEDTQTDFDALDVLRNTTPIATSIDICTSDGFDLNNNVQVTGAGLLLVGGEAYKWRPWLREGRKEGTVAEGGIGEDRVNRAAGGDSGEGEGGIVDTVTGRLTNKKGQWEVDESTLGLLDLVWPKPDLLIIGTGPTVLPISPSIRRYLNGLGMRLEIQDTRNAAAQFNLLATERGVGQVAAAMIPIGWREGR